MLGYPADLTFHPLDVGAHVLVDGRLLRALAGGIEPVQGGMTERGRQRIGCDHDPDDGGCGRLRPHPVSYGGEEEEGYQRLQAVGSGACRSVNLPIELSLPQTEPEAPVHCGGNGKQYPCCQYA